MNSALLLLLLLLFYGALDYLDIVRIQAYAIKCVKRAKFLVYTAYKKCSFDFRLSFSYFNKLRFMNWGVDLSTLSHILSPFDDLSR